MNQERTPFRRHDVGRLGATEGSSMSMGDQMILRAREALDLETFREQHWTGTFGQYLEGYPEGGGLAQGVVGTLLQLRQLEGEFRTNLGFTNPNATAAAVQVTLYDADGAELIRYRVELEPRALLQDLEPYSRRASRPDLGWGFAEVEVLEGGPVLISASVVDSRTNDATTVPVKVTTEGGGSGRGDRTTRQ